MDLLNELDADVVVAFLRQYGGLIFALLFLVFARSKKKRSKSSQSQAPASPPRRPREVTPIEPGTDATKLSEEYSERQ